MITKEDAISISNSDANDPKLLIQVIQRYIFDMKNIEVDINLPNNFMDNHLMNIAYISAKQFYKNK